MAANARTFLSLSLIYAVSNVYFQTKTSETNLFGTIMIMYDNVLRSLLDRHAPIKQRVVTVRPSTPWHSTGIAQNKRIRRKLERKWRSILLPSDRELYVRQCSVVNNLIDSAKSSHCTTVISDFLRRSEDVI